MTNRLPIPGSDSGDWGDILNSFLEVSLASDGTLNSNTVGTSQLQSNSVTNTQLDVPTQTTLSAVASKYTKPAGGIPGSDIASATITGSNIASGTVTASNLTTGVQTNLTSASTAVQIGGDLGGTSTSPTIAKLQGVPLTPGTPANNQVLTYSTASGGEWIPSTVSSTTVNNATSSTPGIIQLDGDLSGTASSPVVSTIGGHTPVTTSTTLTGGDLSGTLPSPTVAKIQGTTISTPAGGTTSYLNASGTWTTPASAASGTAAGDLSGTYPNPTVAKVNGISITGTPSANQVLTATGTTAASWSTPTSGSSTLASDTDVTLTSPINNQVLTYNTSSSKWVNQAAPTASNATTSAPGIVQLTGDLGGTATSPSVTSIKGITLPSSAPASGNVLTATSSSATTWSTPAAGVTLDSTNTDIQALGSQSAGSSTLAAKADHVHPTTGLVTTSTALGGDLSGAASSATVAKLQGTTLSAPTGGTSAFLNASGTWTTPSGSGNMNTSTYDPAGIAQQVVGTTATQTLTNKSISGSQITSAVANATTASTVTTIPALTGDVTSTGSSNATTVAKIQGTTVSTPAGGATSFLNATGGWTTPAGTGAQALAPTAVKTSAYTASPGDFIPVDASGGSVIITLPNAPADKSRVEIKMINTASNNSITINASGSDVFNKASSGVTSASLFLSNQAVMLQYSSSAGIWYVQSDDLPGSSVYLGYSKTVSSSYTLTSSDHVIMADATSAAFTVTLPTAVGYTGVYNIEAITSTTNLVTVATSSSQTIEGSSTTTLGTAASGALYSAVTLVSDGAIWRIL